MYIFFISTVTDYYTVAGSIFCKFIDKTLNVLRALKSTQD